MPQKGLKKDDGVRGGREKISSKIFPFFPDHKPAFIGKLFYGNQPEQAGFPFFKFHFDF